jgi:hypothetical protein
MLQWDTQYDLFYDPSGFPVEQAKCCGCDLSVVFVRGNWEWLVKHAGRDVAEGAARSCLGAKQQAEDAAKQFLHLVAGTRRAA